MYSKSAVQNKKWQNWDFIWDTKVHEEEISLGGNFLHIGDFLLPEHLG